MHTISAIEIDQAGKSIVKLTRNSEGRYDVELECGHTLQWVSYPRTPEILCTKCLAEARGDK